ncbi:hypothetical protein [Spirillospora sp. NBC_01491]|uniref:hypothetical protein n=1 Tax=Spirillospora sp. NBC_01491 TaxID=2976007 RepID=UPI002E33E1F5|nr:hypothetical protein [Spirillospora sp. NBC_01491]
MGDSVKLVAVMTGCQFALGDIALEFEPMRSHSGHQPVDDEDTLSVEDVAADARRADRAVLPHRPHFLSISRTART